MTVAATLVMSQLAASFPVPEKNRPLLHPRNGEDQAPAATARDLESRERSRPETTVGALTLDTCWIASASALVGWAARLSSRTRVADARGERRHDRSGEVGAFMTCAQQRDPDADISSGIGTLSRSRCPAPPEAGRAEPGDRRGEHAR